MAVLSKVPHAAQSVETMVGPQIPWCLPEFETNANLPTAAVVRLDPWDQAWTCLLWGYCAPGSKDHLHVSRHQDLVGHFGRHVQLSHVVVDLLEDSSPRTGYPKGCDPHWPRSLIPSSSRPSDWATARSKSEACRKCSGDTLNMFWRWKTKTLRPIFPMTIPVPYQRPPTKRTPLMYFWVRQ